MSLINKDHLLHQLDGRPEDGWISIKAVRSMIEAEEEKTGRWIVKTINTYDLAYGGTGYEPVYECSVCGRIEESYLRLDEPIMPEDADFPNYCPNCGARMDAERKEE